MVHAARVGLHHIAKAQLAGILCGGAVGDPLLELVRVANDCGAEVLLALMPVVGGGADGGDELVKRKLCLPEFGEFFADGPDRSPQVRGAAELLSDLGISRQPVQLLNAGPGGGGEVCNLRPVGGFSQTCAVMLRQVVGLGEFGLVVPQSSQIRRNLVLADGGLGVGIEKLCQTIGAQHFRQEPLSGGLMVFTEELFAVQIQDAGGEPGEEAGFQILDPGSMPGQLGHLIQITGGILLLCPALGQVVPAVEVFRDFTDSAQILVGADRCKSQGFGQGRDLGHDGIQGGGVAVRRRAQIGFQGLAVLGAAHHGQRMPRRMTDLPRGGGEPLHGELPGVQCSRIEGSDKIRGKGRDFGGILAALVGSDEGEQGRAAGLDGMELLGVVVQLGPQSGDLPGFGGVGLGGLGLGDLGGVAELLQHILFLGFVGVELQTEGADADAVQPLFHHLQGGHFFRHEEDPLALGQGVGNQGGDGLGFAGAGGTVEHEASALAGGGDGVELGGIRAHGQEHLLLRYPFPDLQGFSLPGELTFHQTADHLVSHQIVTAVSDVVPHDELGEGEDAQARRFQHIPPGLVHDGLADDGQHPADVHSMLIGGQGIHALDDDAEVLLELFKQRDVHLGLLVPEPDDVALGGGPADHFDGKEHDGGVAGLGAALAFVPAEHAQSEIEGIRAVFFQRGPGTAVEVL